MERRQLSCLIQATVLFINVVCTVVTSAKYGSQSGLAAISSKGAD